MLNALPVRRCLTLVLVLAATGCASSRLETSVPAGVDLSGEWVLDPSLSDDPAPLAALEKSAGKPRKADDNSGSSQAAPPEGGSPGSPDAPPRMRIRQQGTQLSIQGLAPEQAYIVGQTAACGTDAQCHAAWRGPVFIVDKRPKKGQSREESYALDEQGHLIVTIQAGKVDVKLAYDRARG